MSPEAVSRLAARHRTWLQPPLAAVKLEPELAGTTRRAITMLCRATLESPTARSARLTAELNKAMAEGDAALITELFRHRR